MVSQKNITFEEKILAQLRPIQQKRIILACSGWPDSMVLLEILRKFYWTKCTQYITVGHIHHWLRESAERDKEIVEAYCAKYNLTCECLRAHVREESQKTKTTIEECARNIRKQWLENIRIKYQAQLILTAHHADDQAETLLYRIVKWTSITGLVGIEWLTENYFRPLLSVSKREILEYAKNTPIPYGLDETNEDTTIPRNLLRHEILPQLQIINPEVGKALERLGKSAQEIKEGFDIFFAESIKKKEFDYDWYHALPLWFQHELLRCFYEVANGSTHGFSRALVWELDRFLSTRTGGKKEFWNTWLAKKQGKIYLT